MIKNELRKIQAEEAPVLAVRGLMKQYKGFSLTDVTFTLPKGYIMGYVGPNGAGKTTTMKLITQTAKASAGAIFLDGKQYEEEPLLYKEKIGFVSGMSYFPMAMKIKDIGELSGRFYPTFQKEKFYSLVKEWGLPEQKKLMSFSSGMLVKLMFAAVLSRETRLLILDEATNGLDIIFREEILHLLQKYIEDGEHSVLFATHIIEDLEQIADYIVMIDEGRIILQDSKEELLENYILIRGDRRLLEAGEIQGDLLGLKRSDFGFSALVRADDAMSMPREIVMEKPSVSQIMSYLVNRKEIHDVA